MSRPTYVALSRELLSVRNRLDDLAAEYASLDEDTGKILKSYADKLHEHSEWALSREGLDPLTKAQGRVLAFIRRFMADKGMPPTRVEIANGLGFTSANAAQAHLEVLARKRIITLIPGTARGLKLEKRGVP